MQESSCWRQKVSRVRSGLLPHSLGLLWLLRTGFEFGIIELYKKRYGDFLLFQPITLLAFEAFRLIREAHRQQAVLDQFLRRGPVTDCTMKEYLFESDGGIAGLEFKAVTY